MSYFASRKSIDEIRPTNMQPGCQPQSQLGDGFLPIIPKAYGFEAATPVTGKRSHLQILMSQAAKAGSHRDQVRNSDFRDKQLKKKSDPNSMGIV